jgi:hypothetical protein
LNVIGSYNPTSREFQADLSSSVATLIRESEDHRIFRKWWDDRERTGDRGALVTRTTKPYDRTGDEITLDEVERIAI